MIAMVGWLIPGASHALQGEVRKAATFFVVLVAMVAIGVEAGGRLFPFQVSDPLVLLAAAAEWSLLLPRLVAGLAGYGPGEVVAVTYEYGNTFLITAGLLNTVIVLDAIDLATGRKSR